MYPFREGSFAPRNCWYVAAFSTEITEKPLARTILGLPVALYRKADGEAVAVGGRCPHRNFPLGKSTVNGDDIVCGYHGIAFGPDGRCTHIPSQKVVPGTYKIPTYPLVEHGIWLWIWMGDPEKADPSLLPDLEEIGFYTEGTKAEPIFFNEVKCRYQLLNDNLLDLTHLAFLHGTSIGVLENATVPEVVTQDANVLRSRRHIVGAPATPHIQKRFGYTGAVDQVVGMDFYLPSFHAGFSNHIYAADHPELAGEPIQRGLVFHAITPATRTTSYYFFAIATIGEQANVENAKKSLGPVIEEDIFASEEIEKMIELVGGNPTELMIKTDRNAVLGRRMLQAMMDEETEAAKVPA
ncbi:iron-sulfur protein [Altericroceibacterium spongiae]|uniref:Iron-sulfur protein n=2 Tax=Altericroceibacterium spongiae TaxID=2320269 RepID=A0A420EKM8_9SPHN|nr:iron-sulfur protein [Altericroceibacterium spongiae]